MKMRLRDIINDLKKRGKELKYTIQFTGPNRSLVRLGESKSRHKGKTPHGLKMKPRNWNRDKHKRRKEQKRRRKQAWK
jgi:hypothetical protein